MARVIKAEDLNLVGTARAAVLNLQDLAEQARKIVLDSRRQAATILAAARAQANELRAQALESARAEGFAAGREEGLSQGRSQAQQERADGVACEDAELSQLARRIVEELGQARAQLLSGMRREMLEFSLELAAKIVGQVAVSDIGAAHANLAKVLELAGSKGEIIVKVNPGQLRRLQDRCRELSATLAVGGPVTLVGDHEISPGGVKLISRCGEIDATIETQLANVAQSLVGGMGKLFENSPAVAGEYVPQSPAPADRRAV